MPDPEVIKKAQNTLDMHFTHSPYGVTTCWMSGGNDSKQTWQPATEVLVDSDNCCNSTVATDSRNHYKYNTEPAASKP